MPNPHYRRYESCPHVAIAQEFPPSIKLTPIADPFGDDVIAVYSKDEGDGTSEEGKVVSEIEVRRSLFDGCSACAYS